MRELGGPPGWPYHPRAWPGLGPRLGMVAPPRAPPTPPFRLFIPRIGENLYTRSNIHEKFRRRRRPQP
jgi:hypothetical protein